MRRILLTYILLFVLGLLAAQAQRPLNTLDNRDRYGNQVDPSTQPDSLDTSTDVQSIPPKLYMWQLSETLGNRTIVPADTLSLNFQNTNLVDGMTGQYNSWVISVLPVFHVYSLIVKAPNRLFL